MVTIQHKKVQIELDRVFRGVFKSQYRSQDVINIARAGTIGRCEATQASSAHASVQRY